MKRKLLLVISLVVGIAGLTGSAIRADVALDLGLQRGGSVLLLPPAQLIDPPPAGAAKEPLVSFFLSPAFTCPTGAIPLAMTPSFGFVILNTHGPDNMAGEDSVVSAEVVVKDGIPDVTYEIFIEQDPGNCLAVTSAGTLTTNGQGNGNGHVAVSRVAGATNFWVVAFNLAGALIADPRATLFSPAATLD